MKRVTLFILVVFSFGKHVFATHCPANSIEIHESAIPDHGCLPDFGVNATRRSNVVNGNWSNALTWSPTGVPGANDVVVIMPGHNITYDMSYAPATEAPRLKSVTVEQDGHLTFQTNNTSGVIKLKAINILVKGPSHHGGGSYGVMTVGTPSNPVLPNAKVEIIIGIGDPNFPNDPSQYTTSLIVLGKLTMCGATKTSFVRLAASGTPPDGPRTGTNSLALESSVTGWSVGDRIVVPDSHQLRGGEVIGYANGSSFEDWSPLEPQWEEFTITSVSGNNLSVSPSLKYNHFGARDGDGALRFLPHVANLTRNVVIRSEEPIGTGNIKSKGHTLFSHRADIDIRYVRFQDLGRTTIDTLDDVTNHIGRYPIHFHHVMGPVITPANGYQFTLIGNAMDGGSLRKHKIKWPVTIHGSHYGLIQDNVTYNYDGSHFHFEDGSESFNVVDHNFSIRGEGVGGFVEPGTAGTGFWFRGPNNYVRNNVAANLWSNVPDGAYGFKFQLNSNNIPGLNSVHNLRIPNFKGADTSMSGEYTVREGNYMKLLEVVNNEVYACPHGFTHWWINSIDNSVNPAAEESLVKDLKIWHVHNIGVYNYPSARMVFDGLIIIGKDPETSACCGQGYKGGDYGAGGNIIRNSDIEGVGRGVYFSVMNTGGAAPQILENTFLRNSRNIVHETLFSSGDNPDHVGPTNPPRHVVVKNVRFADWPGGNAFNSIEMNWNPSAVFNHNTGVLDELLIYNYQGQANVNFRVYYKEQATQNIAGGLAPCNDTTSHPEIRGITCPIGTLPSADTLAPGAPRNMGLR